MASSATSTHRRDDGTTLTGAFLSGLIDRRTFMRRAAAMGLSASAVAAALAARSAPSAFAQDATPQPSSPRPDGTPAPDDQQVLRMVTPSPFRMDPPTYGGDLWRLQQMVYQGLTRVETDGSMVPGIADSWESTPDGTVWTFKLNPNAMFSDGTPITAEEVKWTFD